MPSHLSLQAAIDKGHSCVEWQAKQIANTLADRAARESELPSEQISAVLANERWAHSILHRLVVFPLGMALIFKK